LSLSSEIPDSRITYYEVEYRDHPDGPKPEQGADEDDDDYWERYDEWERTRPIKQPEPNMRQFDNPGVSDVSLNLRNLFREKGLQVIVKMANIMLTPENPEYNGGSWHIEGQLVSLPFLHFPLESDINPFQNERICSTAIYYYDCENITESTLRFRHRVNTDAAVEISYEQDRHEFVQQVFGIHSESGTEGLTQELGGIVCQEDRLLTFPNTLQHCVAPFSLADRSKPGHRKILALFLVDPHMRIISSANVPPQREDWAIERENVIDGLLSRDLPVELQCMVREHITSPVMSMDEAKEHRLALMAERSVSSDEINREFESGSFSLCEH
jgi:hypothetical protein